MYVFSPLVPSLPGVIVSRLSNSKPRTLIESLLHDLAKAPKFQSL